MPPRRSCFLPTRRRGIKKPPFQCHHGVPASRSAGHVAIFGFGVSMPPRRSCFRTRPGGRFPTGTVSMPPRRSCFLEAISKHNRLVVGFNATTAFLLLGGQFSVWDASLLFQCHHGVPASNNVTRRHIRPPDEFQCHHGVPASRPFRSPTARFL